MAQHRNGKTIAWSALVLAIIALVFSLLAFTQMNQSDTSDINEGQADVIEMRSDLRATEDELLGNEPTDEPTTTIETSDDAGTGTTSE
jgi:hypothetical protein